MSRQKQRLVIQLELIFNKEAKKIIATCYVYLHWRLSPINSIDDLIEDSYLSLFVTLWHVMFVEFACRLP